mmetsp:Transcript_54489/g.117968  ORF Transcript_54489/g.117968 Transcript_54489/m.117968 type:complete len:500 (+) Transcript_54489:50-1549(+)
MNWPPLSPKCTQGIAAVLEDVVRNRPRDMFAYVAQQLQDLSGLDPEAFEAHFEECRARPRTYVLEDICPAGQDPFAWIRMRYNDDTILTILEEKSRPIFSDILQEKPIEDFLSLCQRARVAFPELAYLRDSPDEMIAIQHFRAMSLGFSGCPPAEPLILDDSNPMLCFRCEALFSGRADLFDASIYAEDMLEALFVCCLMRILGGNEKFRARLGGGQPSQEMVALYAIEREEEALPSFQRLGDVFKQLIVSTLQAQFPLGALVCMELVPAHFAAVKELLLQCGGGVAFFVGVLLVDHMVQCRNQLMTGEDVELIRRVAMSLTAVEKLSPMRAYELLLKKRAERHNWRLTKDDLHQKTVVRLCCMAGVEDHDAWGAMLQAVESLTDEEQAVLREEFGRKDGLAESPAYVLVGAGEMLAGACANSAVGPRLALKLVIRIFEDAAKHFQGVPGHPVIRIQLGKLPAVARDFSAGADGTPFEETQFKLEELNPDEVAVRLASD